LSADLERLRTLSPYTSRPRRGLEYHGSVAECPFAHVDSAIDAGPVRRTNEVRQTYARVNMCLASANSPGQFVCSGCHLFTPKAEKEEQKGKQSEGNKKQQLFISPVHQPESGKVDCRRCQPCNRNEASRVHYWRRADTSQVLATFAPALSRSASTASDSSVASLCAAGKVSSSQS